MIRGTIGLRRESDFTLELTFTEDKFGKIVISYQEDGVSKEVQTEHSFKPLADIHGKISDMLVNDNLHYDLGTVSSEHPYDYFPYYYDIGASYSMVKLPFGEIYLLVDVFDCSGTDDNGEVMNPYIRILGLQNAIEWEAKI